MAIFHQKTYIIILAGTKSSKSFDMTHFPSSLHSPFHPPKNNFSSFVYLFFEFYFFCLCIFIDNAGLDPVTSWSQCVVCPHVRSCDPIIVFRIYLFEYRWIFLYLKWCGSVCFLCKIFFGILDVWFFFYVRSFCDLKCVFFMSFNGVKFAICVCWMDVVWIFFVFPLYTNYQKYLGLIEKLSLR